MKEKTKNDHKFAQINPTKTVDMGRAQHVTLLKTKLQKNCKLLKNLYDQADIIALKVVNTKRSERVVKRIQKFIEDNFVIILTYFQSEE